MYQPMLLAPRKSVEKLEKVTKEEKLKCPICFEAPDLPVQSCDFHLTCYKCLWTTVLNSQVHYDDLKIEYSSTCPSCRQNRLSISDERSPDPETNQLPKLKGIHIIASNILEILCPGNDIKCSFCDFKDGILGTAKHVQECKARPLRCPRSDCQVQFPCCESWHGHTVKNCGQVRCTKCTFTGKFQQVLHHHQTHQVTELLIKRLTQLAHLLRNLNLHDDPRLRHLSQEQFEQAIHQLLNHIGTPNEMLIRLCGPLTPGVAPSLHP